MRGILVVSMVCILLGACQGGYDANAVERAWTAILTSDVNRRKAISVIVQQYSVMDGEYSYHFAANGVRTVQAMGNRFLALYHDTPELRQVFDFCLVNGVAFKENMTGVRSPPEEIESLRILLSGYAVQFPTDQDGITKIARVIGLLAQPRVDQATSTQEKTESAVGPTTIIRIPVPQSDTPPPPPSPGK